VTLLLANATAALVARQGEMPRDMVQRTFPDGLDIPANAEGAAATLGVVERNAQEGVTWVHSYVTDDKKHTFCVYESIRTVAARNGLPVDGIDEVRVLDPYFHH
jgi:predicted amidohydrolase YtcJ